MTQLLNHVVATLTKFSDFAEGQTDAPRTPRGDLLLTDPDSAFAGARARALVAWTEVDPQRRCRLPFGEFSAGHAAAIAAYDVLVHAWDLAQAVGAPVQAPSERLLTVALGVSEGLVTPDAVADGFYAEPEPGLSVSGWADLLGRTGRGPSGRQ